MGTECCFSIFSVEEELKSSEAMSQLLLYGAEDAVIRAEKPDYTTAVVTFSLPTPPINGKPSWFSP